MHVLVAYSRPRGIYGRYVFTVMIYFSEPTETADIQVGRDQTIYSCGHCGKWASITTYETLSYAEHHKDGLLELYRYDSVEPGDHIYLTLRDSDLLFYQHTVIIPGQKGVAQTAWPAEKIPYLKTTCYAVRPTNMLGSPPSSLYDITMLDWDGYIYKQPKQAGKMRVEEELIRQTMNAEQITIKELLLEPKGQPLEIEGQKHFIEAEMRYLDK